MNTCNNKPYGNKTGSEYIIELNIWYPLRDLVPFVQFKKHKSHPLRSINFRKPVTLLNTPPWVFFIFLKLYKWYQIAQRIKSINQRTWYHVKHDVLHQPVTYAGKASESKIHTFFQCERDDKNRSFRQWKNSNENKHT